MIQPRAEVAKLALAEHGGRNALTVPVAYDFSVCLNAYGTPPSIVSAMRDACVDEYPDPSSRVARRVVAERWGCSAEEISLGAGAAELIQAVCFAYLRRGDSAMVVRPAFGEYERAIALVGARVRGTVMQGESGMIDDVAALVREIRRTKPRLAFIGSPVSPTGEVVSTPALEAIANVCRDASCLLILDQSYDGFQATPAGTPMLRGHEAVLHLRSLTKDFALAGVRVALGVGPANVIDAIERVRVPWAASAFAQAAAIATCSDEATACVRATSELLRGELARITARCGELGLECSASRTHYMTIGCGDARVARERLLAGHGILVRDCASFGMPDRIRVAARTPQENDALIAALPQIAS